MPLAMKCPINNGGYLQLRLRTILHPASWWLAKNFDSCTAAFAVEIFGLKWANSGTLPAQCQQWHPCEWQDQDGSQDKQNYHCMMAGVELDRCATVHEMSNQQSEGRTSPTQTWITSGKLVATYNFAASPFLHCMVSSRVAVQLQQWHPFRVARLGWLPSQANLIHSYTACWLASNSTNMLLAMKCPINNGGYLQLRSFTFFAPHDLYSRPF